MPVVEPMPVGVGDAEPLTLAVDLAEREARLSLHGTTLGIHTRRLFMEAGSIIRPPSHTAWPEPVLGPPIRCNRADEYGPRTGHVPCPPVA